MITTVPGHHEITVSGETLYIDGRKADIAMTVARIRIGCTVITVDAVKRILQIHRERFFEDWQTVQSGEPAPVPDPRLCEL